ncbi:hypothetical protein PFTANZ_06623, partial [Plasmodium falciparum Tanzania (2000708)]
MKRLAKIKEDCEVDEDDRRVGQKKPKCSCYGEHCDDQLPENPSTFKDLWCQDCGKSCRSYRKWIERKKLEFTEQKKEYGKQEQHATSDNGNKYDSNFVEKLKQYASIDLLLQNLGACSKNNNTEEDKIEFDKPHVTFRPATNCKPCSSFKINCNGNGHCNNGKEKDCKTKTVITVDDIKKMRNSTDDVSMLVSDNSPNGLEDILEECVLGDCKSSGIFEGIRKDVWTCDNVCGYNVCKQENGNGENVSGKANSEKQFITIRALLHRWLEYFLEDYNKIRTKLKPCIENGNDSACIDNYDKKYTCVNEWIEKKRTEWTNIKKHYLEKNENIDDGMTSLVKNFLEEFKDPTEVNKAIKPCDSLTEFARSSHCNGTESSGKKGGTPKDIVECLLNKLKKKIETFQSQHQNSGENQANCGEKHSTPVKDDEEDLLLEEENTEEAKKKMPKFCNIDEPTKPEEDDEKCDPATTEPSAEETAGPAPPSPGEGTEKAKPPPATPAPPIPRPRPQPPQPYLPPALKNAMLSSTIMWSIGIGFAAFTYFFLK